MMSRSMVALLLLPPCYSALPCRLGLHKPNLIVGIAGRLACLRGGISDVDDFYEVLSVKSNATSSEIKRAYRQRSLETHPDRNKDPDAHEQFIRVGRAFETLKDPAKRASYDQARQWRRQQRKQRDEHRARDEGQDERWRPPPRSQPEEPYHMEDALKTFRSFFGYAVDVLGESQLDRLLEVESPFYAVARSTWIATSLAYVLFPNATAAQREETRRAIDAALTFCVPLLSRTIGRRNAARLLGYLAIVLTPLALSRYAVDVMPTAVQRAVVGVGLGASLWRIHRLDLDERKALVDGCSRAASASVDLVARIVGVGREQSQRWLMGLALVLVPLALAQAAGAVGSALGLARLAAGRMPGVVATWTLGMLVAAVLWLSWEVGAPKAARRSATEPEEEEEPG